MLTFKHEGWLLEINVREAICLSHIAGDKIALSKFETWCLKMTMVYKCVL